jgi:nucleotide-binding universal stress UspA family protein
MNKILVPTDYSEQAGNAVDYAVKVAQRFNASIVLFHAFHVPVPTMESTIILSLDDIEQENEQRLKKEAERIKAQYGGNLTIETLCKVGFAEEAIAATSQEKKCDLIIMGSNGASGIEEVLIGTNAAGVIERSKCPILVIPENYSYREPKNIVFAYDYHDIKNENELLLLKKIAKQYSSTIQVLHIDEPDHETTIKNAASGIKIDHLLDGYDHEMFFMQHDDIEEAILDFVKQKSSDMVVMMPHKHGFFSRLFHTSSTVKMAFHTHVPLLCLPDKH